MFYCTWFPQKVAFWTPVDTHASVNPWKCLMNLALLVQLSVQPLATQNFRTDSSILNFFA